MTWFRRIGLTVTVVALLLVAFVFWALGTESGTRWVFARAAGFIPDELVISEPRGTLLRGIDVQSVEWRGESTRVLATNVYIDAQLMPLISRHVAVDELDVELLEIMVRKSDDSDTDGSLPTIDLPVDISIAAASLREFTLGIDEFSRTAEDVRLSARLFGSDLDVMQLGLRSAQLSLDLDGRMTLADFYSGRARVAWQWDESATTQFAGQLQIDGDMRQYEVRNSLTAPLAVSTSGNISFVSGNFFADLLNEWESLEISIGERRLYSSAGSLRVQGNTAGFAAQLDADASFDDLPDTRIELEGDADLQGIQVARLDAVNELGRLLASGSIRWSPELRFTLDYAVSGLDPSMAFAAVTGTLDADGRIDVRFAEQAPIMELHVARLGGSVNGFPVDGKADVAYAGADVTITGGRIRLGSNRAEVEATIGEKLMVSARVDLAAIGEIMPDASGAISGTLVFGGSRDRPDLRLIATGTSLEWQSYALGDLRADIRIAPTGAGTAELQLERLAIDQTIVDSIHVAANGRTDRHTIRSTLRAGDNEMSIVAAGGYAENRWAGRIDSLAIENPVIGRWSTLQANTLVVARDEFTMSQACLLGASDSGKVCIGGSRRPDGSATLDLSLTDLPLAAIPATLPADVGVSGYLDAHLRGQLAGGRLSADTEIALRDATIFGVIDDETITVAFTEAIAQATIADNRVESVARFSMADDAGTGGAQFSVQDFADLQSAISGQGDIAIDDASLFAILVPGVANPRGRIFGTLTVSGSLREPEFLGEVTLTEGSFGVLQSGITVSDVNARLSQQATGSLRLDGSMRSGDGEISVRGETTVGADSGIRTELVISGENFELARLPDWRIAASPSMSIVFDERVTSVSGSLQIPTARISLKEIPETAESPSPDAVVHRQEGAETSTQRRIDVDIETTLGSDVELSGFGLNTGIEGTVRLRGGTHAPYLGNGRLTLRDGRYEAYGQELEIERGELIFNGPLDNPQLDIRAVRRLTDVVAGIQLSGTPSALRSNVFSEPALSDAEALSYLLTGRPLASATTTAEGDALNNAAFALGVSGAGTIASRIGAELGLETLTVEGGVSDGRIVAGKRIGNRLLVEYGYGLIDKLGTLLLRYQLSDRLVLESRTGTISNLDIVYSVKKQ